MSIGDGFIPNSRYIAIWSMFVWSILCTFMTFRWWIIARTSVELGVIGVDNRAEDNIANVRIDSEKVDEVAPLILSHKLGRNLRAEEIKHWKRILVASYEKISLNRDFIRLKTIQKFPFCCHCARRTHTKDEYTVLLKDVHFIETGTDTDPYVRSLGKVVLMCGLALHLSVFLDSFIIQFNAQSDEAENTVNKGDKWIGLIASIAVFVLCYFAAGLLKRDFIHVGVFPDDFSRGSNNPWGGHSPFYLQMGMYYASAVNRVEPFDEVVKLIRSAQTESKQLDHAEHRDAVNNPHCLILTSSSPHLHNPHLILTSSCHR